MPPTTPHDISWPCQAAARRPYVRWWWLDGPFHRPEIQQQLDWIKANGFGGVEIAWLEPLWSPLPNRTRPDWLSAEWSRLVEFVKTYADLIGLGCDFTFGSAWPFGGGCISDELATQSFTGPINQHVWASWEEGPRSGHRILNHLDHKALQRYSDEMLPALEPALKGATSALFCDSLEVRTEGLWNPRLWDEFERRFGYRIDDYVENLHDHPDVRYDYRKLIARTFTDEFFRRFADICRQAGAVARVQCHGAPVDLLEAYAAVDVPESEALLFEPGFSRIAASAAALAGKPTVSAEAFTCIYGFFRSLRDPARKWWKHDQTADLKLLADALFANGVNQIVWHGMPYNPDGSHSEFYASVHVGPDAQLAAELPRLNQYLAQVSSQLCRGKSFSQLAVYLAIEDAWMVDRIPEAERTPAANYRWEMRHARVAADVEGFSPLWVSAPFLQSAEFRHGKLQAGEAVFDALEVDSAWLDASALTEILRLAESGLPVVLRRRPRQPGFRKSSSFEAQCDTLQSLPCVVDSVAQLGLKPLISGESMPQYWARLSGQELTVFFAHPMTRDVRYPMHYGQALCEKTVNRLIHVCWESWEFDLELQFAPSQSLLYVFDRNERTVRQVDIEYRPPAPRSES